MYCGNRVAYWQGLLCFNARSQNYEKQLLASSCLICVMYYEGKSLNNNNFILKCMEKYAQWKILFLDTKWHLSNMPYRCRDDRAVWACAVADTIWPLRCQLSPWKNNEVLLISCGQREWNLLKSTEEWRFGMETVVWLSFVWTFAGPQVCKWRRGNVGGAKLVKGDAKKLFL
jgi:hypothetical protein